MRISIEILKNENRNNNNKNNISNYVHNDFLV